MISETVHPVYTEWATKKQPAFRFARVLVIFSLALVCVLSRAAVSKLFDSRSPFRINFYGGAPQAYPMSYKLVVFRSSVTGGKRGQIVRECKVKRYLNKCAISSFLILILLFVSYSLISFNFYLFYIPGAAAEPLGSAREALTASRSTGWEPLLYSKTDPLLRFKDPKARSYLSNRKLPQCSKLLVFLVQSRT